MSHPTTHTSSNGQSLSLGVIFLTIFIDLLGFTIIFPLFPAILDHYLTVEGTGGILGWILARIDQFAELAGSHANYRAVLFGGVLGSLYAFLQFIFAPIWGGLSDRIGRRRVLLITVTGTTLSYVLWFFSVHSCCSSSPVWLGELLPETCPLPRPQSRM